MYYAITMRVHSAITISSYHLVLPCTQKIMVLVLLIVLNNNVYIGLIPLAWFWRHVIVLASLLKDFKLVMLVKFGHLMNMFSFVCCLHNRLGSIAMLDNASAIVADTLFCGQTVFWIFIIFFDSFSIFY